MDESRLFLVTKRIYRIAYEYADSKSGTVRLEDLGFLSPNPTRKQTKSGLFVEFVNGGPAALWTPWGEWDCWGESQGDWNHNAIRFLGRLSARKHTMEKSQRSFYSFKGSLYAVKQLDGERLPKPILFSSRNEFRHPEDALNAWKSFSRVHESMEKAWGM